MTGSESDRRGFIRVPFNTRAEINTQGRFARSIGALDISMSGLRMTTEDAVPAIGAACLVHIILQASEHWLIIEAQGKVIRSKTGTMAVEFTELDADSYDHLRNLILNNAEDPEKAEKEFNEHWGIKPPER